LQLLATENLMMILMILVILMILIVADLLTGTLSI